MKATRETQRRRRHERHRNKIVGTAERPRLNVRRTGRHFHVQVIDDSAGRTLAAATTDTKDNHATGAKNFSNLEWARRIGALIAERSKQNGVTRVVFDCGGGRYHGAVKALAEAAREGGMEF